MILEVAVLNVKSGEEARFEAAFSKAGEFIQAAQGYIGHELRHCIGDSSKYLLLVRWVHLEDHTKGFRGSAGYQQWAALLHQFYKPFPQIEYYSEPLDFDVRC
ncbi:MAG: antibiotic biosynthesis monooxygenase [Chromatiales bacterium]|nr:antibiotic biosynthesis monooxygenase [Chromatiales bacterium]